MLDVEYEPLTGSPAALVDHADAATRTADRLDDARARLVRIHDALEAQRSHAVTTAQDRLTDVAERLSVCSGVLRSSAAVVHGHAHTLATEQSAATRAIARRDEALRRERSVSSEISGLLVDSLALLVPSPSATTEQRLAEVRVSAAQDDVRAAEADWRRARDAKRTASARAAASIEALADRRAVNTFVRSGASVEAFQRSWAHGLTAAGLVDAALPGNGDALGAPGRAELRSVFLTGGEDTVFWSAFWRATTPRELYLALGHHPLDDELASTLRAGVERWSQSATPGELTAFGRGVVDGLMPTGLGLSEQAAISALLLSPGLPGTVHAAAAQAVADRRAAILLTEDEDILASAAVAAMNGLIAHPRVAFDYFAPGSDELLAQRARQWFGTEAPGEQLGGWPDGGEAVAGALLTAVSVGGASLRSVDQSRAALLVSHATTELPKGLLAGPALSDLASARVASAYERYVPVFGDVVVASDSRSSAPGTVNLDRLADGYLDSPPVVVQPVLDPFALVEVVSATSRTETAADVWLGVGDRYHDAMLGLALSGAVPVDRDVQDSIAGEALRDVGTIAGSLQAERLRVARRDQAEQDQLVEGASFLVGVGTVTAAPPLALGATAVTTVAPHVLPDHVGPVRDTVLANEQTLRRRFAESAYAAAIEREVEAGLSAAQAAERRAELSPDSHATRGAFQQTYDLTADLRRELRDNQ